MKQKHFLEQFALHTDSGPKRVISTAHLQPILKTLPFLQKTLCLKNPPEDLAELNLSKTQLSLLKGSGILIGVLISFLLFQIANVSNSLFLLFAFSIFGGFVGWFAPEIYILDRLKSKQFFIQQAIPDFLDQFYLLVSSPAYESFGQSLHYIAPSFPGYLGDTLRSMLKVQPFVSERELLLQLEKACKHPLITELATVIQVSNTFGSSLSKKTYQLIQTAQIEREYRIKDLGNKTSGVLLGPLLIFHLPALLIIFLIPFVFILQKGF